MTKLTAHQIRAVAVAAERDDRTVVRYLRGLEVRQLSALAIERALDQLGLRARNTQEAR